MYSCRTPRRGNQKQRHRNREERKQKEIEKRERAEERREENYCKGLSDYFSYAFDLKKKEKLSKYFVMS